MNRLTALSAILLMAACGTMYDDQEIEATRDFVAANQLAQVDDFRLFQQLNYHYLNDNFVSVDTRRGDYLLEFRTRCRALTRRDFTPDMVDVRRDPSRIEARFDTIRGCRIDKIYSITEEQRKELRALGDAPGDEIFLPDQEQDSGAKDDES